MDYPDLTNGLFECLGALAILGHVVRVLNDKNVAGVSIWAGLFFTMWGVWNMWYYPHLDQWWSFYGTLAIVTGNVTWISLLYYYKKHPGGAKAELEQRGCSPSPLCAECGNIRHERIGLARRNVTMRELIAKKTTYIELLEGELCEVVPYANGHGWHTTRMNRGEAVREEIAQLEEKL